MASQGTRRYQAERPRQGGRGVDPFSYARGISTPAAPRLPMPPSPAGTAPPGPPTIYEPRITPAEQRMKGAAAQASQLSDVLSAWSDRFYKQAAAAAEYKGTQAGTLEGLVEGQVELRGGETIYDRAFNAGALEAYKGSVRLDAKRTIGEYAARHQDDVGRYDTLVGVYMQETLREQTDPQIQAFTRRIIEERALEYRTGILKKQVEDKRVMALGIWEVDLYELEKDLALAIQRGDQAAAGNKVADIAAHLAAGVESQLITAPEGAEKSKKFEADAVFNTHITEFRDEMRDGNGWEYYKEFVFGDARMPLAVRQRIKKEMENEFQTYNRHQDRVEKVQRLQVEQTQRNNFIEGLGAHDSGTLTANDTSRKLHERAINTTQYTALMKLAEEDKKEAEATVNRITEYSYWVDIYDGLDEEEKSTLTAEISLGLAQGRISASTATSMLKIIVDPNFQAVTKNADYQFAVTQINTELGRASGPLAFLEPSTANTVSAARRELYNRSSAGENPLSIVDDIIARGLKQLGRNNEPGIVPRYSAWKVDGSYDIDGAVTLADVARTSGEITYDEFIKIYNEQMRYWKWHNESNAASDTLGKSEIEKKRREDEREAESE